MNHLETLEVELRARLWDLRRRDGAITRDLRAGHDGDWVEQATERENEPVLEGLDEMTRAEVAAIQRTLDQIRSGRYGVCVSCQQPIPAARLSAEPTATQCIACVATSK
jgi:DnaK suppressor protein